MNQANCSDDMKRCKVDSADNDTASRVMEQLRGLRLGAHERRILLLAAPPGAWHGARIDPPQPGRSADEAHRRAIRTLLKAGLVEVDTTRVQVETKATTPAEWIRVDGIPRLCPGLPITRTYLRRSVALSPLGAAVAAVVRPRLGSGNPIRWERHAAAIAGCLPQYEEEYAGYLRHVEEERRASDQRLAALTAQLLAIRTGGTAP